MKAAVLEKIEDLGIKEVAKPFPRQGEILLRVKACAICGTDVKVYHHGHRLITFPRITGHEVTGEIVETGKGVEGYKVGDRVAVAPAVPCGKCFCCRRGHQEMCENLRAIGYFWDGGFAEYMVVPEVAVANGCVNCLPENISFEEGTLAEPLACVINAHELSEVELGDTVVVIGAGPIGCMHVELARVRGASKIILVEISEGRLNQSKKIVSADVYVNSGKERAVERVKKETQGRGADKVIVACGSGKAQMEALQMVAIMGNINFFGGLPKDASCINFDSNIVHYKECSIVGTHGSSPRHNQLALRLIAGGRIEIGKLITHRLPLERLREGIEIAEKGKGLKVIIQP